jgi:hypothetical protein
MSSPQVEGMTLDGLEVMEEVGQGNKKKKKGPPRKKATCNACHIAGHSSNNSKECLLTIKPLGKHYKPENVGAKRKFCYVLFVYVTMVFKPDH